ncbi:hypothetical protein CCP4SC76_1880002 [Gammaproteobacteria bacterium]
MFTISKISTHARELNKEQHSTRYSKIIETLRLSSQSGSNLPEFLDPQNRVGTHPESWLDTKALGIVSQFSKLSGHRMEIPVQFIDDQANGLIEAVSPVYVGESLWGGLRCGISLQSLNHRIEQAEGDWKQQMIQFQGYFFTIGFVFFTIGVAATLFFTRLFVKALARLSDGVTRVSGGDLLYRIGTRGLLCSEFLLLSESFNQMTGNLLESREKLDEYNRSLEVMVSERTEALQAAQAELVNHAREAGMAEIAQGVMHNIGNALTPLKTSAQMAYKGIRESTLRRFIEEALQPVSGIVESSDHPDKSRLSQIVQLIPSGIENEYQETEDQLKRINERIEHIENIIHLQSKYARIRDFKESLDFNQVVRDALGMMEDSLKKYGVQVETRWGKLPDIRGEKHQLLQVLLNLIKNADEAMRDTPLDERRLIVTTEVVDSEKGPLLVARLTDTGCGFTPEAVDRLFGFGYTTKVKGSGIGLHASANYLIAQKGKLEAFSDGPGQGATFVISLFVA